MTSKSVKVRKLALHMMRRQRLHRESRSFNQTMIMLDKIVFTGPLFVSFGIPLTVILGLT
jgi:hypothetical protein